VTSSNVQELLKVRQDNLENGDRVTIEHPENIAFDPGDNGPDTGSSDFYVISSNLRSYSTFEAVTHVAPADAEGRVPCELRTRRRGERRPRNRSGGNEAAQENCDRLVSPS